MRPLDPAVIRQQVEQLKLLHPEIWEDSDEQLILDCLEGQTDATEFLRSLEDSRRHKLENITGISARIADNKERLERYKNGEQAIRDVMFMVLQSTGLRRFEMPESTLSIANGKSKVVIVDEAALPKECLRIKTEPDKTVIKTMLDNFETVPGACLSNPEPHLVVRVK